MTGDDLKLAIKADKRTVEEISKLFGITRNTLYLLDCSSNSYPPTFNRVIKLYKNIYINGVWKDSISKFYYKDTTFTVR